MLLALYSIDKRLDRKAWLCFLHNNYISTYTETDCLSKSVFDQTLSYSSNLSRQSFNLKHIFLISLCNDIVYYCIFLDLYVHVSYKLYRAYVCTCKFVSLCIILCIVFYICTQEQASNIRVKESAAQKLKETNRKILELQQTLQQAQNENDHLQREMNKVTIVLTCVCVCRHAHIMPE